MNRSLVLALAGLAVLTVLAALGHLPAEAVVTFLGGLMLDRPELRGVGGVGANDSD